MDFSDQIKERKNLVAESAVVVAENTTALINALECRINELESDLDNALEDKQGLHDKLQEVSSKRDEYRELVGELVEEVKGSCDSMCCGYESKACTPLVNCPTLAVLTKAKMAELERLQAKVGES